jgi:hypothetical protein
VRAAGLAALRLNGRGRQAVRNASAAGPAEVELSRAGTDEITLRWDSAYPMALVRDAASGEILAFARGGNATITSTGPIRVELSRGPASVEAVVRGRK